MPQYPRYAIYFVPPAHSMLYRFGASLLGYDALSGAPLPFADGIEVQIDGWKEMTIDPRKYGFHATLKAPMVLADGKTEAELLAACAEFAATPRPIPTIKPVVSVISDFIAVVPSQPSASRFGREQESFARQSRARKRPQPAATEGHHPSASGRRDRGDHRRQITNDELRADTKDTIAGAHQFGIAKTVDRLAHRWKLRGCSDGGIKIALRR